MNWVQKDSLSIILIIIQTADSLWLVLSAVRLQQRNNSLTLEPTLCDLAVSFYKAAQYLTGIFLLKWDCTNHEMQLKFDFCIMTFLEIMMQLHNCCSFIFVFRILQQFSSQPAVVSLQSSCVAAIVRKRKWM